MDYEKMWKELKEKIVNLSPHYGEINKIAVIKFIEEVEQNNEK